MKLFSQVRSCFGPTVVEPHDEPATRPTTTTTTTTTTHEQVAFSKRKKLMGSKSGSAAHWRPALSVISEDVVVPLMEESTKTVKKSSSTKTVKKSSSTKTRSITESRSCNYRDEYSSRKSSVPIIFPAFSPTPFMF